MQAVILALDPDLEGAQILRQIIESRGHAFYQANGSPGHGQRPGVPDPDLVIAACPGVDQNAEDRIDEIGRQFPDAQVALLVEAAQMRPAMLLFKGRVDEFIQKPVDETDLEMVLHRVVQNAEQKVRCRQLELAAGADAHLRIHQMPETERFIIVKQLVDKMSSFIGQIARDVEDGVRYFHSTPYFVSIHSRNLKVVANDAMYQRYFGARAGADSWAVYCGKTASPENCPVGKTLETDTVQRTKAVARYAGGRKLTKRSVVHRSGFKTFNRV